MSLAANSLKHSYGDIQDAHAQVALSEIHRRAVALVEGIRGLSHNLHPSVLRLVGLASALEAHCIEVEKRHDVGVGFKADGDLGHVHPDIGLCLFRIAQEALRNGAVYGEARRLAVSIARSADHIELTITDDGRGFDLEAVRRDGSGLGLVSMEERAHVVGGDLQIITRPGHGTTIRVRIPAGAYAGAEKGYVPEEARLLSGDAPQRSKER
jgi:signal transduction histidine kinase